MQAQTELKTFLVANGDWSAGWGWKMMHPLMCAAGHRLLTPTYTGLGEREHLAHRTISTIASTISGLGSSGAESRDRIRDYMSTAKELSFFT
jgi:hypothetical protein